MSSQVPITFLGGYSAWKGLLGVISFPDMLSSDTVFCRFFTYNAGEWGRCRDDFMFDGKSLTYLIKESDNYRAWWLLGKNGEAVEIRGGVPKIEQIPGAGLKGIDPYGYVNTIKNIGGELYVCGYGRQVYKRIDTQWVSIANDILTRESANGFFDIDGAESSHVCAVGWNGDIYFHDGQSWHKDDSPTNAHLTSVRCFTTEDIWICGNGGVVLHGGFNRWTLIKDDAFTGNWYCIEEYNGRVYLAGNGVLAYIDGNTIKAVDVGLDRAITTYRLHSNDGLLWSIGEKDILVFDGSSWREITHPDNI